MAEVGDNRPMTSSILRRLRLAVLLVVAAMADASAQTPSITVRPDGRLDVSAPPAEAVMRYTLDGTDPTRDAGEWLAPVRVPPGYTVKARAVAADGTPVGEVATWSAPPASQRTPSTLVPVTQNRDWRVYDWTTRHREASALMRARQPDIVMLGDSITHFWGGEPVGGRRTGVEEWDRFFAGRTVVNLGYGWDRTENVLWRLENGEFEGVTPKVVVLMSRHQQHHAQYARRDCRRRRRHLHVDSRSVDVDEDSAARDLPARTTARCHARQSRRGEPAHRPSRRSRLRHLPRHRREVPRAGRPHLGRPDVRLPSSDREGLCHLVGGDGADARAPAGWPIGGARRPGGSGRQAGSRFANRAISFFWPTLANRTISLRSASPPSTAMIVPTPNCGWRTRRPAL